MTYHSEFTSAPLALRKTPVDQQMTPQEERGNRDTFDGDVATFLQQEEEKQQIVEEGNSDLCTWKKMIILSWSCSC